jgi:hypothetical protein
MWIYQDVAGTTKRQKEWGGARQIGKVSDTVTINLQSQRTITQMNHRLSDGIFRSCVLLDRDVSFISHFPHNSLPKSMTFSLRFLFLW